MRDRVEKELEVSLREIGAGNRLGPRVLINTPEGEFIVYFTIPEGEVGQAFALVRDYMAYRMVDWFVLSHTLIEPDGVASIGISRNAAIACAQEISLKTQVQTGRRRWAEGAKDIGEQFVAMLPGKEEALSSAAMDALDRAITNKELQFARYGTK